MEASLLETTDVNAEIKQVKKELSNIRLKFMTGDLDNNYYDNKREELIHKLEQLFMRRNLVKILF